MSAGAGGGAVVRCGHLRKLKTMKKKYFVLRGDTPECSARLEYYESEKKFTSGTLPRRALPLRSCFNITRRLDLRQKHVIALFTKEEQFCVVAESETELHAWLSALLRLHRADDASDHLQHPIQHVWQVNVQKKGLGASKNIQGLYNLCLTDKTLTLVKIKSHNNVISDLGIPERVEFSLKNIRRCGDSECFFYMEVGRQTVTGAGELWMLSDDSNIAQSMHSTIYHAMRNCAKETENERDHVILPKKGSLDSSNPLPARRQTYSDGRGRAGLLNDAASLRSRCDSMPARTSSCDVARLVDSTEALAGRDEPDAEWLRTPRIPEEPDSDDRSDYLCMSAHTPPTRRLPLSSCGSHSSEFHLESVPALIAGEGVRPARAYSVGSAPPAPPAAPAAPPAPRPHRTRAYSAGARRATPHLMELDFTPPGKSLSRSSAAPVSFQARPDVDEYVDMSPRSTAIEPKRAPDGYVEMTYGRPRPSTSLSEHPINEINSLYVKMNAKTESENNLYTRMKGKMDSDDSIYTRVSSKNDSDDSLYKRIKSTTLADRGEERGRGDSEDFYGRLKPPSSLPTERSLPAEELTPHGSQTIFPFSPEDEVQPPVQPATIVHETHALSTVSELSEDTCGVRQSESFCESEISSSPASYVRLKPQASLAIDVPQRGETNVTATVLRLPQPPLNYAALDLEPRRVTAPNAPTNYTQIDFVRSDKLHADAN